MGKNLLCADKGYIDIDEKYCKAAAEEKGLVFNTVTNLFYPKNCYLIDDAEVFFNYHSVGIRQSDSAPICTGIFHRSRITTFKI